MSKHKHEHKLLTCRVCGEQIVPEGAGAHLATCRPEVARAIADEYSMVERMAKRTAEESKLGYVDAAA